MSVREKATRILRILQVITEYLQDCWLFLLHNGYSPFEPRDRRLSHKTIIEAHTIEKGLALPKPRAYFGQSKIRALLDMNDGWTPPPGDLSRSMLLGALRDYRTAFANSQPPDPELAGRINSFLSTAESESALGGVRENLVFEPTSDEAAISFLGNRFSARDFGQRALNDDEIAEILGLAQRAPSQCNRQATRVHVYRDRARITRLLGLQGGARGFIDVVPTLLVVTSEITAWGGPQQRNQPYIDGGIFTMMLLLALGAHGFVSCALNLGVRNHTERQIKTVGDIPSRERLVAMIATGTPPSRPLRAAGSPRWGSAAICTLHDGRGHADR